MCHHMCVLMVAFSCSLPHLHSLLPILMLNELIFYDSNIIHLFLCDFSPLVKLSCLSISVNKVLMMKKDLFFRVPPFNALLSLIVTVVHKIPSAAGKPKAFSTCGHHVTMVTLFYRIIFYVYLQPVSSNTVTDNMEKLSTHF